MGVNTAATIGDTLPPEIIRALSERSNLPGMIRAGIHFGSVFVVGWLILWLRSTQFWPWSLPLLMLQGFLISFLFMPMHECMHRTAFRSQALNRAVGTLASLMIVLPFEYYFVFHWAHHRNTQDPERDPELLVGPPIDSDVGLALAFSGVFHLIDRIQLLLRHAFTGVVTVPWVPASQRRLIVVEARCYVAFYLAIMIGAIVWGSIAVIWAWFLPLVFGQSLLRPYLLSEHTGCDTVRSAFGNTRTTYTSSLIRWFAWNMPYHVEHHAYPTVPFHALPHLNAVLAGRILHPGFGYRNVIREVWVYLRRERANDAAKERGA